MGPFLGGIPPAVALEGDLVFGEKIYICTADRAIGYVQRDLEILSRGRSGVAVGCWKCW
jgi:hypothetical protein